LVKFSSVFIGKGGPTEGAGIALSPKTKKLVTSGPYKYTRNTMVFGAFCLYFGFSILLNSLVNVFVLSFLLLFALQYLKSSEEKRLLKDFGQDFLNY